MDTKALTEQTAIDALRTIKATLERESNGAFGWIFATICHSPSETLFDFIDNTLAALPQAAPVAVPERIDVEGLTQVLNMARCNEGRTVGNRELALRIVHFLGAKQEAVLSEGWKFNHAQRSKDDEGVWEIGFLDDEDDRFSPILTVDTGLYYQDNDAEPLARAILARLATPPAPGVPTPLPSKDALAELIREHMHGVYHCTRVWEAWNVGTMSQEDFESYSESDSPEELADAILGLASTQAVGEVGE